MGVEKTVTEGGRAKVEARRVSSHQQWLKHRPLFRSTSPIDYHRRANYYYLLLFSQK